MQKDCCIAEVILDSSIGKGLDYLIPPHLALNLRPGTRVEIPLRNKREKGYILQVKKESSFTNLKSLISILPEHFWVAPELFELGLWMSRYYLTPLDRVFRCMIPSSIRTETEEKKMIFLELSTTKKKALEEITKLRTTFPAQARVLESLLKGKGAFRQDLLEELKISKSPIDSLIKKKLIEQKEIKALDSLFSDHDYFETSAKQLNSEQERALKEVESSFGRFQTHLLYGITGSGKTEVYMQLMQKLLDLGKSIIILVPEVALTSHLIEKFRARFPEKIALLHHKRSKGERSEGHRAILEGKTKIILGARSAIFAPAKNLGLIIIDEEHDSSYKQTEEAPTYHARDVAIMRASMQKIPVLLGSATPAIESFYKAKTGKYQLHFLTKRATSATLPKVRIIDLKKAYEKNGGYTHFSSELLSAIQDRYKKGEQTLLFLNRRGYYAAQLCANCSYEFNCPHCDSSLTFHKKESLLKCHLCGYAIYPPRRCPSCNSLDMIKYKGFGTEHIERSLHAIFPEIRTLRMDRDTTKRKNAHEDLIYAFRSGKADLMIGTQMIAKGFHFPSVTLVGVLNTDGALHIPDFRSSEYVFQLLTQVAGRAGRAEIPGEVIIQTHMPNHPIINRAKEQDYLTFYESEIESRQLFGFPPFSRLIKCTFSSVDASLAQGKAEELREKLLNKLAPGDTLYPVIEAPHAKIKDHYRFQFLLKTTKIGQLLQSLAELKKRLILPSKVKLLIDVDPTMM